jgi:hypothetical protein
MLHEKKHVKFDQNKDEFVKPEFLQGMYNQIYINQLCTGIYVMHP